MYSPSGVGGGTSRQHSYSLNLINHLNLINPLNPLNRYKPTNPPPNTTPPLLPVGSTRAGAVLFG